MNLNEYIDLNKYGTLFVRSLRMNSVRSLRMNSVRI